MQQRLQDLPSVEDILAGKHPGFIETYENACPVFSRFLSNPADPFGVHQPPKGDELGND